MSTESPLEQWCHVFFWALFTIQGAVALIPRNQKIGLLYGRVKANSKVVGFLFVCVSPAMGGLDLAEALGWTGGNLAIFFGVLAGSVAIALFLSRHYFRLDDGQKAAPTSQPAPPREPTR